LWVVHTKLLVTITMILVFEIWSTSRFVLGKCHFSLLYFGCQCVASFDLLHFVFIAFAFAKLLCCPLFAFFPLCVIVRFHFVRTQSLSLTWHWDNYFFFFLVVNLLHLFSFALYFVAIIHAKLLCCYVFTFFLLHVFASSFSVFVVNMLHPLFFAPFSYTIVSCILSVRCIYKVSY
jgi:hypothetical protein